MAANRETRNGPAPSTPPWLEYLFLIYVFSLGFMRPTIRFLGFALQFSELIFLALAAAILLLLISRRRRFAVGPILLPIGVYFAAILLSTLFSADPEASASKLAATSYLLAVSVVTVIVIRDRAILKKAVLTIVAASTLVSIIGTLAVVLFYLAPSIAWSSTLLHHYGSLPPGNYPRIQSTFIYPAMLCNYLTVGVMLLLSAFRSGWVRGQHFLPILSVHIVAAFFTLTPGLGGFLLSIALWIALVIGSRRPLLRNAAFIAGPATAALSILVAAFTLRGIPTSPFRLHFFGINIDPTQRLLTWQDAVNTFISNPLFGKGLGLRVAEVKFLAPSGQMQLLTDAHNSFLSLAAQAGVPGLAAIMVLCFLVYRTARDGIGRGDHLVTAMLIAFVSAFVVQGMTGSFEDARHLWLLIGLIYAGSQMEADADGP